MQSSIFVLSWKDVCSALVSMCLVFVLTILTYIISVGSIFNIEWRVLIDTGVLPTLVFVVSMLKSFLTTKDGNFIGVLPIK